MGFNSWDEDFLSHSCSSPRKIVGQDAFRPQRDLLGGPQGGDGRPSSFVKAPREENVADPPPTRLTARGILGLAAEGPFAVHDEEGSTETWACPKYDPDLYDEKKLRAFKRIVGQGVRPSDADLALFDIRTGEDADGQSLFHAGAIVSMMRQYTLITLHDGKLTESHKDFCKRGQTEHILWVQAV